MKRTQRNKRFTITVDAHTATRARTQAAERKMSLSRYIGEVLCKELRRSDAYEAAYRA
jgi:predicted HicB family RNase H-like nuclease